MELTLDQQQENKLKQIKNSIGFLSNTIEGYEKLNGSIEAFNCSMKLGITLLQQETREFQLLTDFIKNEE